MFLLLQIPEAWGTVKVQANGAGHAILQMTVQYNVDIVKFQTQPPVRSFDLHTRANFHGRNQSHISYTSCQRYVYRWICIKFCVNCDTMDMIKSSPSSQMDKPA